MLASPSLLLPPASPPSPSPAELFPTSVRTLPAQVHARPGQFTHKLSYQQQHSEQMMNSIPAELTAGDFRQDGNGVQHGLATQRDWEARDNQSLKHGLECW